MANSPQWADIERLYHAALAQPLGERAAFLDEASAGDTALREEVASLLRQGSLTEGFLNTPAVKTAAARSSVSRMGQQIGVYRILSSLGAGGMGEVYRARDTRLSRDVAIKLLPPQFAADPDRCARFEREARVLATLNDPHIAQIYGFEDAEGVLALVMELVEGETLEARVGTQGLPLADAIGLARQIAVSLRAAHEKGIIHRDLKPANIKITPEGIVKVLDFGLAKATLGGPFDDGSEQPPTIAGNGTREGLVLGTPAYMSPEQARGKLVDKRTDIWAFGCVLFEMLSGRRAFAGETASDTIARILEHEPDWEALPASTPDGVRILLLRCLEKDLDRRLQSIDDVNLEASHLDSPSAELDMRGSRGAPLSSHSRSMRVAGRIAVLATVVLSGGAVLYYSARTSGAVTDRSEYAAITDFSDAAVAPSLSPDGTRVAFKRGADAFGSTGQIYVKPILGGDSIQLTNDFRRKNGPAFTPDGLQITYTATFNTPPGPPSTVFRTWVVRADGGGVPSEYLPNAAGLTWLDAQRNLYAEVTAPHFHMPLVTSGANRVDRREIYSPPDDGMVHFAYASPNRGSVLVVEMDRSHVFTKPCRLVPFDGSSAGREVGPRGTCTSAAWSPDGNWMYFTASVGGSSHVWRQRFPSGTPEQITWGPSEEEGVTVGPDGRWLVTSVGTRRSAIWLHDGDEERAIVSEGYAASPRISQDRTHVFYLLGKDLVLGGRGWMPASSELRSMELSSGNTVSVLPGLLITDYDISRDDRHVAFTKMSSGGEREIWLAALDRRTPPRLIAKNGDGVSFGAEGELVFRSLEGSVNALVRVKTDTGERIRLTVPVLDKYGVSPDGEWALVFSPAVGTDGTAALVAVPFGGGAVRNICSVCTAAWSPDGRFLYVSVDRRTTATSRGKTVAIPIPAGKSLPDFLPSGIASTADAMKVPGAHLIDQDNVFPGPSPATYAFQVLDLHRNLFRIPLH